MARNHQKIYTPPFQPFDEMASFPDIAPMNSPVSSHPAAESEVLFPGDLLASRLADLRLRLADPDLAPVEREEMAALLEDLLLQAAVRGLSQRGE